MSYIRLTADSLSGGFARVRGVTREPLENLAIGYAAEPGYLGGYPLKLSIGRSKDNRRFTNVGVLPTLYEMETGIRDPAIDPETFTLAHSDAVNTGFVMRFCRGAAIDGPYTALGTLNMSIKFPGDTGSSCAAMNWCKGPTGLKHLIFMRDPNSSPRYKYEMHPVNAGLADPTNADNWSTPVQLVDVNGPIEGGNGYCGVNYNTGVCYLFNNNELPNPSTGYLLRRGTSINGTWSAPVSLTLPGITSLSGLTDANKGDNTGVIVDRNNRRYVSISNGNSITFEQWTWYTDSDEESPMSSWTWNGPEQDTFEGFGELDNLFNWMPKAFWPDYRPLVRI